MTTCQWQVVLFIGNVYIKINRNGLFEKYSMLTSAED